MARPLAPPSSRRSTPSSPVLSSDMARDRICSESPSCAVVSLRRPRRRTASPSPLMLLFCMMTLFVSRSAAVLVSTFDNCLSDEARNSDVHMQFHPILVSAAFGSQGDLHDTLRITVWGEVTGASSTNPRGTRKRGLEEEPWVPDWAEEHEGGREDYLPALPGLAKRQLINGTGLTSSLQAPATYFGDDFRAAYRFPSDGRDWNYSGSIVDAEWDNKATTLKSRIQVSSFLIDSVDAFFCHDPTRDLTENTAINATCPMGNLLSAGNATSQDPVVMASYRVVPEDQRNNITFLTQELPTFTVTRNLGSEYQFATFGVTLRIVAGDGAATDVGCVHVEITPELKQRNKSMLTWLFASVLMLVGIASIVAAMFNPWNGTTDVFRFSSNYGMDDDMLRLVTPGFADCLQWLQFIVLTGSLSLSYPGFYQPIVSRAAWSILMMNSSYYTHDPISRESWKGDGIYAFEAWVYGYERMSQAVGFLTTNDVWVSVMAYFAVLLVGAIVIFQIWFWGRWALWKCTGVEEEDLTRKNLPFTAGIIYRFTYTYFLLPVLAACAFQLAVASRSLSITAGACVILVLIVTISVWLTYHIMSKYPRSELYDTLPTLLVYGTFYNTYREKSLRFFMCNLYINILRAIAFGALQPSGIAQITILAACEIAMILSIYAIKPYAPATSMNLWHFIFSCVRLLTILLMMAFVPSINSSDTVKGWLGWVILGIHAAVMLFGFVLKALQTILEVAVRACRSDEEAARGGFAKVFGVRQLSRRKRHSSKTHRSSTLSPTPIVANERSPAIERPPLVVDSSQHGHTNSNSNTSAATTPITAGYGHIPPVENVAGPYYRPPRTRRVDGGLGDAYSPTEQSPGSWSEAGFGKQRSSQASLPAHVLMQQQTEEHDWDDQRERGTPAPSAQYGHRYTDSAVTVGSARGAGNTDYAVREVDFYYGVRGPALSAQPQRRLGTGPADPTGPVSNAKSWIKQKLGLARGEKEKGFSVVRSSKAPMQRVPQSEPSAPIGVAITSDNDPEPEPEPEEREAPEAVPSTTRRTNIDTDTSSDYSSDEEPGEPGPSTHMLGSSSGETNIELKPTVPRKSSKRRSSSARQPSTQLYDPPIPRLPFEDEHDRLAAPGEGNRYHSFTTSSRSSSPLEPPQLVMEGRPGSGESLGRVSAGRVGAVVRDERGEVRGSQAELVRGGSGSSTSERKGGGEDVGRDER